MFSSGAGHHHQSRGEGTPSNEFNVGNSPSKSLKKQSKVLSTQKGAHHINEEDVGGRLAFRIGDIISENGGSSYGGGAVNRGILEEQRNRLKQEFVINQLRDDHKKMMK
jgi:hypothetical protein